MGNVRNEVDTSKAMNILQDNHPNNDLAIKNPWEALGTLVRGETLKRLGMHFVQQGMVERQDIAEQREVAELEKSSRQPDSWYGLTDAVIRDELVT